MADPWRQPTNKSKYWEAMLRRYEERNAQLESQECELRHKLEALECSLPVMMYMNAMGPPQVEAAAIQVQPASAHDSALQIGDATALGGINDKTPYCSCTDCTKAKVGQCDCGISNRIPQDQQPTTSGTASAPIIQSSPDNKCACGAQQTNSSLNQMDGPNGYPERPPLQTASLPAKFQNEFCHCSECKLLPLGQCDCTYSSAFCPCKNCELLAKGICDCGPQNEQFHEFSYPSGVPMSPSAGSLDVPLGEQIPSGSRDKGFKPCECKIKKKTKRTSKTTPVAPKIKKSPFTEEEIMTTSLMPPDGRQGSFPGAPYAGPNQSNQPNSAPQTPPDKYSVLQPEPIGRGSQLPGNSTNSPPVPQTGFKNELCDCRECKLQATNECECSPQPKSNVPPSTALSELQSDDISPLDSEDFLLIERVKRLAEKEKTLKYNIRELHHKENALNDTFGTANLLKSNAPSEGHQGNMVENLQRLNNSLLQENSRLSDELADVKLDMKQTKERLEGPMQRELEREKRKNKNFEDDLERATAEKKRSEETLQKEVEFLNKQLLAAAGQSADLNAINARLKEELVIMDTKCNELHQDLINQKISEANTLSRLKAAQITAAALAISAPPLQGSPLLPSIQPPTSPGTAPGPEQSIQSGEQNISGQFNFKRSAKAGDPDSVSDTSSQQDPRINILIVQQETPALRRISQVDEAGEKNDYVKLESTAKDTILAGSNADQVTKPAPVQAADAVSVTSSQQNPVMNVIMLSQEMPSLQVGGVGQQKDEVKLESTGRDAVPTGNNSEQVTKMDPGQTTDAVSASGTSSQQNPVMNIIMVSQEMPGLQVDGVGQQKDEVKLESTARDTVTKGNNSEQVTKMDPGQTTDAVSASGTSSQQDPRINIIMVQQGTPDLKVLAQVNESDEENVEVELESTRKVSINNGTNKSDAIPVENNTNDLTPNDNVTDAASPQKEVKPMEMTTKPRKGSQPVREGSSLNALARDLSDLLHENENNTNIPKDMKDTAHEIKVLVDVVDKNLAKRPLRKDSKSVKTGTEQIKAQQTLSPETVKEPGKGKCPCLITALSKITKKLDEKWKPSGANKLDNIEMPLNQLKVDPKDEPDYKEQPKLTNETADIVQDDDDSPRQDAADETTKDAADEPAKLEDEADEPQNYEDIAVQEVEVETYNTPLDGKQDDLPMDTESEGEHSKNIAIAEPTSATADVTTISNSIEADALGTEDNVDTANDIDNVPQSDHSNSTTNKSETDSAQGPDVHEKSSVELESLEEDNVDTAKDIENIPQSEHSDATTNKSETESEQGPDIPEKVDIEPDLLEEDEVDTAKDIENIPQSDHSDATTNKSEGEPDIPKQTVSEPIKPKPAKIISTPKPAIDAAALTAAGFKTCACTANKEIALPTSLQGPGKVINKSPKTPGVTNEIEIESELETNAQVNVNAEVMIVKRNVDGINVTTTMTKSGTLEVITEGPAGIVETIMTLTESGNIEVETHITDFETEDKESEEDSTTDTDTGPPPKKDKDDDRDQPGRGGGGMSPPKSGGTDKPYKDCGNKQNKRRDSSGDKPCTANPSGKCNNYSRFQNISIIGKPSLDMNATGNPKQVEEANDHELKANAIILKTMSQHSRLIDGGSRNVNSQPKSGRNRAKTITRDEFKSTQSKMELDILQKSRRTITSSLKSIIKESLRELEYLILLPKQAEKIDTVSVLKGSRRSHISRCSEDTVLVTKTTSKTKLNKVHSKSSNVNDLYISEAFTDLSSQRQRQEIALESDVITDVVKEWLQVLSDGYSKGAPKKIMFRNSFFANMKMVKSESNTSSKTNNEMEVSKLFRSSSLNGQLTPAEDLGKLAGRTFGEARGDRADVPRGTKDKADVRNEEIGLALSSKSCAKMQYLNSIKPQTEFQVAVIEEEPWHKLKLSKADIQRLNIRTLFQSSPSIERLIEKYSSPRKPPPCCCNDPQGTYSAALRNQNLKCPVQNLELGEDVPMGPQLHAEQKEKPRKRSSLTKKESLVPKEGIAEKISKASAKLEEDANKMPKQDKVRVDQIKEEIVSEVKSNITTVQKPADENKEEPIEIPKKSDLHVKAEVVPEVKKDIEPEKKVEVAKEIIVDTEVQEDTKKESNIAVDNKVSEIKSDIKPEIVPSKASQLKSDKVVPREEVEKKVSNVKRDLMPEKVESKPEKSAAVTKGKSVTKPVPVAAIDQSKTKPVPVAVVDKSSIKAVPTIDTSNTKAESIAEVVSDVAERKISDVKPTVKDDKSEFLVVEDLTMEAKDEVEEVAEMKEERVIAEDVIVEGVAAEKSLSLPKTESENIVEKEASVQHVESKTVTVSAEVIAAVQAEASNDDIGKMTDQDMIDDIIGKIIDAIQYDGDNMGAKKMSEEVIDRIIDKLVEEKVKACNCDACYCPVSDSDADQQKSGDPCTCLTCVCEPAPPDVEDYDCSCRPASCECVDQGKEEDLACGCKPGFCTCIDPEAAERKEDEYICSCDLCICPIVDDSEARKGTSEDFDCTCAACDCYTEKVTGDGRAASKVCSCKPECLIKCASDSTRQETVELNLTQRGVCTCSVCACSVDQTERKSLACTCDKCTSTDDNSKSTQASENSACICQECLCLPKATHSFATDTNNNAGKPEGLQDGSFMKGAAVTDKLVTKQSSYDYCICAPSYCKCEAKSVAKLSKDNDEINDVGSCSCEKCECTADQIEAAPSGQSKGCDCNPCTCAQDCQHIVNDLYANLPIDDEKKSDETCTCEICACSSEQKTVDKFENIDCICADCSCTPVVDGQSAVCICEECVCSIKSASVRLNDNGSNKMICSCTECECPEEQNNLSSDDVRKCTCDVCKCSGKDPIQQVETTTKEEVKADAPLAQSSARDSIKVGRSASKQSSSDYCICGPSYCTCERNSDIGYPRRLEEDGKSNGARSCSCEKCVCPGQQNNLSADEIKKCTCDVCKCSDKDPISNIQAEAITKEEVNAAAPLAQSSAKGSAKVGRSASKQSSSDFCICAPFYCTCEGNSDIGYPKRLEEDGKRKSGSSCACETCACVTDQIGTTPPGKSKGCGCNPCTCANDCQDIIDAVDAFLTNNYEEKCDCNPCTCANDCKQIIDAVDAFLTDNYEEKCDCNPCTCAQDCQEIINEVSANLPTNEKKSDEKCTCDKCVCIAEKNNIDNSEAKACICEPIINCACELRKSQTVSSKSSEYVDCICDVCSCNPVGDKQSVVCPCEKCICSSRGELNATAPLNDNVTNNTICTCTKCECPEEQNLTGDGVKICTCDPISCTCARDDQVITNDVSANLPSEDDKKSDEKCTCEKCACSAEKKSIDNTAAKTCTCDPPINCTCELRKSQTVSSKSSEYVDCICDVCSCSPVGDKQPITEDGIKECICDVCKCTGEDPNNVQAEAVSAKSSEYVDCICDVCSCNPVAVEQSIVCSCEKCICSSKGDIGVRPGEEKSLSHANDRPSSEKTKECVCDVCTCLPEDPSSSNNEKVSAGLKKHSQSSSDYSSTSPRSDKSEEHEESIISSNNEPVGRSDDERKICTCTPSSCLCEEEINNTVLCTCAPGECTCEYRSTVGSKVSGASSKSAKTGSIICTCTLCECVPSADTQSIPCTCETCICSSKADSNRKVESTTVCTCTSCECVPSADAQSIPCTCETCICSSKADSDRKVESTSATQSNPNNDPLEKDVPEGNAEEVINDGHNIESMSKSDQSNKVVESVESYNLQSLFSEIDEDAIDLKLNEEVHLTNHEIMEAIAEAGRKVNAALQRISKRVEDKVKRNLQPKRSERPIYKAASQQTKTEEFFRSVTIDSFESAPSKYSSAVSTIRDNLSGLAADFLRTDRNASICKPPNIRSEAIRSEARDLKSATTSLDFGIITNTRSVSVQASRFTTAIQSTSTDSSHETLKGADSQYGSPENGERSKRGPDSIFKTDSMQTKDMSTEIVNDIIRHLFELLESNKHGTGRIPADNASLLSALESVPSLWWIEHQKLVNDLQILQRELTEALTESVLGPDVQQEATLVSGKIAQFITTSENKIRNMHKSEEAFDSLIHSLQNLTSTTNSTSVTSRNTVYTFDASSSMLSLSSDESTDRFIAYIPKLSSRCSNRSWNGSVSRIIVRKSPHEQCLVKYPVRYSDIKCIYLNSSDIITKSSRRIGEGTVKISDLNILSKNESKKIENNGVEQQSSIEFLDRPKINFQKSYVKSSPKLQCLIGSNHMRLEYRPPAMIPKIHDVLKLPMTDGDNNKILHEIYKIHESDNEESDEEWADALEMINPKLNQSTDMSEEGLHHLSVQLVDATEQTSDERLGPELTKKVSVCHGNSCECIDCITAPCPRAFAPKMTLLEPSMECPMCNRMECIGDCGGVAFNANQITNVPTSNGESLPAATQSHEIYKAFRPSGLLENKAVHPDYKSLPCVMAAASVRDRFPHGAPSNEGDVLHSDRSKLLKDIFISDKHEINNPNEDLNELQNIMQQISSACMQAKTCPSVSPIYYNSLTSLKIALKNLQATCNNQDSMMKAMVHEMQMRVNNSKSMPPDEFSPAVFRPDCDTAENRHLERQEVLQHTMEQGAYEYSIESTVEIRKRFSSRSNRTRSNRSSNVSCAQSVKEVASSYCPSKENVDVAVMQLIEVKRIGVDSLLLKWQAPKSENILGYEICVNEEVKTRVYRRTRTMAVLSSIPLDRNPIVNITVYACTGKGRCMPPAVAAFHI